MYVTLGDLDARTIKNSNTQSFKLALNEILATPNQISPEILTMVYDLVVKRDALNIDSSPTKTSSEIENLLKSNPNSIVGLTIKGCILLRSGENEKALDFF
mmetsp:Transcript_18675/g.16229  ORF Transcript_18675/g.16229 Transcript_18675/m.16229 type:complete len:101 (+) Transcript_18675:343-645(+)